MQSRQRPSYKGGFGQDGDEHFDSAGSLSESGKVSATLRLVSPSENQVEDHPQDLKDMGYMSHQLST